MQVKINNKIEIITVPESLAIYTDKKTGVQSVAFPFRFADGYNGIITLTKIVKASKLIAPWRPSDDLDNIQLNFK